MLQRLIRWVNFRNLSAKKFLFLFASFLFILLCVIPSICVGVDAAARSVGLLPTYTPTSLPTNTATPTNLPTYTPVPTNTNTPVPSKTPAPLPTATETDFEEVVVLQVRGAGCIPTSTKVEQGIVTGVVDGDTIDVIIDGAEYRVRYIGMDTPERNQLFGSEATAKNRELVDGKAVTLVKDVSETDRFNRLLRYVLTDTAFVNYELVVTGFARPATFPPDVACQQAYLDAERLAREAGVGLWSATPTQPVVVQPTSPPPPPASSSGFSLVSLTSPINVGADASLVIQTTAGVSCDLVYYAPSGRRSEAQGLGPTTADGNGRCSWTWRIGTNTAPGTGRLEVTADNIFQSFPIEIVN